MVKKFIDMEKLRIFQKKMSLDADDFIEMRLESKEIES